MAGNALPLLLLVGGAAVVMSSKKKRKKKAGAPAAEAQLGRQRRLYDLGYTEVGGDFQTKSPTMAEATRLFQSDWNTFIDTFRRIKTDWSPDRPEYRKIEPTGVWDELTDAASASALRRFKEASLKGVFVEELDRKVYSFREMVASLAREYPPGGRPDVPHPGPPEPAVADPDISFVEFYPSWTALEASKREAIDNRPPQHYMTLLIGDIEGLSEDAKTALSEWAETNWDAEDGVGWTVMIAPVPSAGELAGAHYAANVWRADVGQFIGLSADELDKDASQWEYDDIHDALDRALGEIPPELLEELQGTGV